MGHSYDCDKNYVELIRNIMQYGEQVTTRNSVCKRIIGPQYKFGRTPLVCARKTAWKTALREWAWFMLGSDNLNDAHPSVRPWWEDWADATGRVANNYGRQLREFNGVVYDPAADAYKITTIDQIQYLLDSIKNHPYSRRAAITTWNTAEMAHPSTRLTNCHNTLTQAFVKLDNTLHLETYQRSSDVIVGLGANWVQQWAFLLWLAHWTGRKPGSLTWKGGDVHIYEKHYDLARKIIEVDSSGEVAKRVAPNLVYTPTSNDFLADDFTLDGEYRPVLRDKAEMVV